MSRYQAKPVAALQRASVAMIEKSSVPLTHHIPPNQKMVKAKAVSRNEIAGFMTPSGGSLCWSHRKPGGIMQL